MPARDTVAVPRWIFMIIVGLLMNVLGLAFTAGILYNKIDTLEKRFIVYEERFYDYIKPKR